MILRQQHRRNFNIAGHAHELTFSCYHNFPFLKAERTCGWLADTIYAARTELGFKLWAYVFMPDHVHLIIYQHEEMHDISRIRYAIKHPMSKKALGYLREHRPDWIPKLQRKRGRRIESMFWQSGGGYDRNITSVSTLLQMIEYIHLNPVRKGFVERPEAWQWSSAAQFAGKSDSRLRVDRIPSYWLDS
jgi:putative transposase